MIFVSKYVNFVDKISSFNIKTVKMQLIDSKKIRYVIIFAFIVCTGISHAQKNKTYSFPDREYNSAIELFALEQYGAAKKMFKLVYDVIPQKYDIRKEQSHYYMGICACLLYHKDAETLILSFMEAYPENACLDRLWFHLGNYYFNQSSYRKALHAYEKIDLRLLPHECINEYEFKLGYAYFTHENYKEAKPLLSKAKEKDSQYTSKALFYYSHIQYLENNYHSALMGFEKLAHEPSYSSIVPFYISHIYFALGDYEKIIQQAEDLLAKSTQKRWPEINRIIAQSHYQLKQYDKAIPYFTAYTEKTAVLSCDDFYEIGICYYKNKQYEQAIDLLTKSFCKDNDSINQYVYFSLGDCYLQTNQKEFASNAFLSAYELRKNPIIMEDALYAYAKLQYELTSNPFVPSIAAFEKFLNEFPQSNYKNEAEHFLSSIYLTTKNYKAAIASLDKIEHKSITLLKAYQRVLYYRGIELYNNKAYQEAEKHFNLAIENNYNPLIYAQSLYWKGEIYYRDKDYDQAINYYNLFLSSRNASPKTDEYAMAYYNLGYAQFKKKQYPLALKSFLSFFQEDVNLYDKKIIADAYNRTGDCYYMSSALQNAIEAYDKVITLQSYDVDYALYQKAQSQGGLRLYDTKIATLETLLKEYPKSNYSIDAHIEMANTYMLTGNNAKAEECYANFIQNNPSSPLLKTALLKLGLIYFNTEQDEKALDVFKKIVKNYPKSEEAATALKNIETIYSTGGNIEEFFLYVKNVSFANITVENQDTIMYNAASEKYFTKQFDDAAKGFTAYLDRFPKGVFATQAHFYNGECAMRKSDFDKALLNYEYVIQNPMDPFEITALQNVADIYYRKGDYEKSLTYFTLLHKKTTLPSQKTQALLGITRSSYFNKAYSNAMAMSEMLLEEPKISTEQKEEAHLIIARSALELNDLKKSLQEYTLLSKSSKPDYASEALYYIAYIIYKQDNLLEAEKKIFEILTNISNDYWLAKSYILLGDIYLQKGNSFQAKHTYMSIIENYDGEDLRQMAKEKYDAIIQQEEALEKQRIEALKQTEETKTPETIE